MNSKDYRRQVEAEYAAAAPAFSRAAAAAPSAPLEPDWAQDLVPCVIDTG